MVTIIAQSEITINASVDAVWQLFAEEFAQIGKWSSGVNHSVGAGANIGNSEYSERACEINAVGFSDTKERMLQYDEKQLLRYSLYQGLPGFVTNAENTWTFQKTAGGTQVFGKTEMQVKGIMGFLFQGVMKQNLKRVLGQMAAEAKYYIENGQPHPDKIKAIASYTQKQARKQPQ
jgi:uncharacterized protein YndB with AHSA1/START domain